MVGCLESPCIFKIIRELIDDSLSILKAKFSREKLFRCVESILAAMNSRRSWWIVSSIRCPLRLRLWILVVRDHQLLWILVILHYTIRILNSRELHLPVLVHELRHTPFPITLIPHTPLQYLLDIILVHHHMHHRFIQFKLSLIVTDSVE